MIELTIGFIIGYIVRWLRDRRLGKQIIKVLESVQSERAKEMAKRL